MGHSLSVQRLRPLAVFFGSSFLLHLLWENLQAPLYEGFTSFTQHFWICFRATFGDLLFMFVIYVALAIVHRNLWWIADVSGYTYATWITALFVGAALAVSYEFWAVYVAHRWDYTSMMPLLPLLRIGAFPVLQMVVVPVSTLFVTSRFSSRL
jgi:hypothetical protein